MSQDTVKKLSAQLDQYATGNAKPPKAFQWKPGQSGNPKGRPKGESLGALFRRLAAAPPPAKFGEGDDAPSRMSLVINTMFQKAVEAANPDAARIILGLAGKYLPPDASLDEAAQPPDDTALDVLLDPAAKN